MKAKNCLEEYANKPKLKLKPHKLYKSNPSEGPASLNSSLIESNTITLSDSENDEHRKLLSITLNNLGWLYK